MTNTKPMQTDETRAREVLASEVTRDAGRGAYRWELAGEIRSDVSGLRLEEIELDDIIRAMLTFAAPPAVERTLHPSDREAIARVVKGARLSAAFGREFRAGDGRLDDVDLDAADAILALSGSLAQQEPKA